MTPKDLMTSEKPSSRTQPSLPRYGPANPHPLSQMKTEVVWEGKYDEYGNRREVDAAGLAMPMQRIETVDQPRSEAAAAGQLSLYEKKTKHLSDFRNRLIWGDNKLVLASLLAEFKGKVDLIYIDPPFDVGADFTMHIPIGDEDEAIEKDQSALEMVAYRDTWGRGTDSYLSMMYERLTLMRQLLSDKGSIFVHCDWHVGHYLRSLMDDVFGVDRFRNEIIWSYRKFARTAQQFPKSHDNILFYTKTPENIFNPQYVPLSESTLKRWGNKKRGGKDPRMRFVTDEESQGAAMPDVWDIPLPIGANPQNTGFQTQKPEGLLEHIIYGSSEPNALVADLFCGSGTTGAVAERLGRRWLMCDLGRFAIHTSRKRLIELQRTLHAEEKPYRSFDVYNLGRYERQWWQKEALHGADDEHRRVVLEFFKAEQLKTAPSPLLHGRKGSAYCHVDGIDSIFSRGEARALAQAVAAAGANECYCLAWEFEMDLRLVTAELQQELGVVLKLIQIPREIMEKNRKNPPPFLEMAVLTAEPVIKTKDSIRLVDIKLTSFIPSLAEVPSKELETLKERAVKSGFDFIDFWAVDFDWQPSKPFNHHWQDYRTRKDRSLKTVSDQGFVYPKKGAYTACVKVVDIFGSDTSVTVEVPYA